MSKVSALQASLQKSAGNSMMRPTATRSSTVPIEPASPPLISQQRNNKPPSREGKIHIGAYVAPEFKKSLRLIQAQTGEDMQTLLIRALNDLFKSHNVPVVDQS